METPSMPTIYNFLLNKIFSASEKDNDVFFFFIFS